MCMVADSLVDIGSGMLQKKLQLGGERAFQHWIGLYVYVYARWCLRAFLDLG